VGVTCTAPAFPVLDVLGTRTITWTACDPIINTDLVLVFVTVTWRTRALREPVTNVPFIGTIQAQWKRPDPFPFPFRCDTTISR